MKSYRGSAFASSPACLEEAKTLDGTPPLSDYGTGINGIGFPETPSVTAMMLHPWLKPTSWGRYAVLLFAASGMVSILLAQAPEKEVAELQQSVRRYLLQKTGPVLPPAAPAEDAYLWSRRRYEAASKQKDARTVLYRLVHMDVRLAEKLLTGPKAEQKLEGLGVALEAAWWSSNQLKDHPLGVAISSAYLMPNLDSADHRHWNVLSKQHIVEQAIVIYQDAGEKAKYVEAYQVMLKIAHNRNTADAARVRLAEEMEKQGKYAEAIRYLQEVHDNEGLGGAKLRIPVLQVKLESAEKKKTK
jgi:tetratricopeptide (TPR) repeat protein